VKDSFIQYPCTSERNRLQDIINLLSLARHSKRKKTSKNDQNRIDRITLHLLKITYPTRISIPLLLSLGHPVIYPTS